MKRILALMVVIVLMFSLTGCWGSDEEVVVEPEPVVVPEPAPVVEEPEEVFEVMEVEDPIAVKEEAKASGNCVDTDGGANYYVKGEAYNPEGGHDDDTCSRSDVYVNRLYEMVCEGDEKVRLTFECPNGCEDGACLE